METAYNKKARKWNGIIVYNYVFDVINTKRKINTSSETRIPFFLTSKNIL